MRPARTSKLFALVFFFALVLVCTTLTSLLSLIRSTNNSPLSSAFTPSTKLPFETFTVAKAAASHPQPAQFTEQLRAFLNIIITQYTAWHRQQRRLCQAHVSLARSVPLLVFRSNGNAGVGDRIRGILYSYLVAVASNRLFFIDWQKPLPVSIALRSPPSFNFTYDAALFTESTDDEHAIWGPSQFNHLDVYFSPQRVIVNQKPNAFAFNNFSSLFERYPQLSLSRDIVEAGLSHFDVQREEVAPFIINALFETSSSLRNSLHALRPFRGQPYISLHARLGHGVGEKSGRFNFEQQGLSLESVSQCIGSLAATMAQQRALDSVFVVTDTKSAHQFLEAGIRAVLPNARVELSPIDATHFFAMHDGKYFPDAFDRQHKFEEVFVDLGLLSMAESMVFFRSGYGVVAAWLGAITDSVMVEYENCTQIRQGKISATALLSQRLLSDIV
ncbi:unnamed protein product [Agarophyton chilense]